MRLHSSIIDANQWVVGKPGAVDSQVCLVEP